MKRIGILLGIILIGLIIGIFWWQNGLLPVDSSKSQPQIFVVKNGEGVREIANNLKTQGLIRDQVVFFLYARFNGLDKQLQAGDFRLNPSMNMNQVTTNLTHGILDIWVTIPEGLRAEEIANILQQKIPSFNNSWRTILDQNEGYLFPDTYLIPRDTDINLVLSLFKTNFQKKFDSVVGTKTTNLSDTQTIALASIIEKEAKFAQDRSIVASVFINRLNIGMPLGSDPTVMYALGYQPNEKTWWKKDLTVDDLAIDSPYNTRVNAGLPPGPISNPGLPAIEAALNPAKTDYLYFFADSKGHLHFATTLEGHQANIQKYGGQ
jgi:UPF0755 protein